MPLVFGYASLTAAAGGRAARADGLRRAWGVAMDNRLAIPGYKVYEDPQTGERPAVHVAFLDVIDDPGAVLDGVLLTVDEPALAALDRRERNYDRRAIEVEGEPAWVYVGSAAGRGRFAEGLAAGTLVVDSDYVAVVGNAPPPPCRVLPLRRVAL
ncbi:MAG: gamma-glutamylcyclotransferase [Solirubrobacterales bacterium]|nr:gamma-glutamylcyclotransferase [Solirubrobacterales bacterium]